MGKVINVKDLQKLVPSLRDIHGDNDEAIKKSIMALVKQGEEEEIPVVNQDGEPVLVEEIILVGAPPEAEAEAEAQEEPAEVVEESLSEETIERAVSTAINKQSQKSFPQRVVSSSVNLSDRVPARAKRSIVRSFKGKDADYKAYAFGTWLNYIHTRNESSSKWLAKEGLIGQKDMSTVNNTAGGAAVPDQFLADLIRLVEEYGVIRQNARVVPMTSDTMLVPRRTGGLTVYYPGEGSAITESDVAFDNVQLTAIKAATLTSVSRELMDDAAISIGDLVANEIAQAFAYAEDNNAVNGDGTSTYGGVIGLLSKVNDGNHAASLSTAASGNTAFSTLDLADFHSLVGKLPQYAATNAKFYISRAGFSDSMERLAHAQGGVTRSETEAGSQLSFLGYPVVITQVANSTLTAQASTVILGFGDLRLASTFGDRQAMEVQTSSERFFDQDQVAIRGVERFDFVAHDLGNASTAGAFVALKTPGS